MNLQQFQIKFRSFLLSRNFEGLSAFLEEDRLLSDRLNIYRNNHVVSLTEALGTLYPVTKRLVGDVFFLASAREYITQFPPKTAAIVSFGSEFPSFLAAFEPAARLPFLSDVSRVELAWHLAYHAEDADVLQADQLSGIEPEKLVSAVFKLHPSCMLIDAKYPAAAIWAANQPDRDGTISVPLESKEHILVCRKQMEVQVITLDKSGRDFLVKIDAGESLESAMEQTMANDQEWNAEQALGFFIGSGVFSELALNSSQS